MRNGNGRAKGVIASSAFSFTWSARRVRVLTLVIHVENGDIVGQRPGLSEVINDLLESALDEGVIEEWPAEVVLCGFFTRADITVFSDFKHLRPQFNAVGGT